MRKQTGVKKVGHAGTLDPFANGVLVVAVGKEFTRQIDQIQNQPKGYVTRMILGIDTDTLDPEGKIQSMDPEVTQRATVIQFFQDPVYKKEILSRWIGSITQTPPRYSAKKINGVPMYALARADKEFEIKECQVNIQSIDVIATHWGPFPAIDLQIACGKGTYIRSLVRDIAHSLGTVGYAQLLIRDRIGDFSLADSIQLEPIQ